MTSQALPPMPADNCCFTTRRDRSLIMAGAILTMCWLHEPCVASIGGVLGQHKISGGNESLPFQLSAHDGLGRTVIPIGDLDDDGTLDVVVRLYRVTQAHSQIVTLFLNDDGSVKSHASSDLVDGTPLNNAYLGMTAIGDLDGDGNTELAVTTWSSFTGGPGSLWIYYLQDDGTLGSFTQLTPGTNGFDAKFDGHLGVGIAMIGDLDGDGVVDLAVEDTDNSRGANPGGVWIVFLNSDGSVKATSEIDDTAGGFDGVLRNQSRFGHSIAGPGDIDGDLIPDLAVTADGDSTVWVLLMNNDGTVRESVPTVVPALFPDISAMGDLDNDGIPDLGMRAGGAVRIMLMDPDGTPGSSLMLTNPDSNPENLKKDPGFGNPAPLGDLNHDGSTDLVIGVPTDDDGGDGAGAVWVFFMESTQTVACYLADVVPDGVVGIDDLMLVIGDWKTGGEDGPDPDNACAACDIDGDGQVTLDDMLIVIQNWGECPGPCCLPDDQCAIDTVSSCDGEGGVFLPGVPDDCDGAACPDP